MTPLDIEPDPVSVELDIEPEQMATMPEKAWTIPDVHLTDAPPFGATCQETSSLTTASRYVPCGRPATMTVFDPRAGRSYHMCTGCGTHSTRNRGFELRAEEVSTVVAPVMALAQILPADFELPALIRFVPDPRLKVALVTAVERAMEVDVTAEGGLALADAALADVRDRTKAITAHFEGPAELSHRLHKSITSTRSEWTMSGTDCVAIVGARIAREQRRREDIAAAARREQQRLADEQARAEAIARAKAVAAQGAPAQVVERMQAEAATVKAAPVPVVAPAPLKSTTVTKTWKARIKGTPADAEPNPDTSALTGEQKAEIYTLLAAIIAGHQPIALISVNWGTLNSRAKAEKGTLAIPGIEAYEDLGTRSKPGRRV